ncbi:hypothetical protein DH2020_023854 [Rehmannia glutinosa]|uniref:Transmembrane protein 45B n=1 Tax=Rehmannia glutinosa TaxID=99300 RepID=A0ABR0WA71_REHGL
MGTFAGHLVPGLALAFLGLRHTINTTRVYFLIGSNKFILRFWYPFKTPLWKLQHLEPILVLSFSIFAIFTQIFDIKHLRFSFELDNIEHVTMFLQLVIFTSFTLFTELTHLSENTLGVSGILLTSVFGQELFLLHYHSTDHIGLEGHYHWLMQLIVFIRDFFSGQLSRAFILSISVMFQGFWFVNMGFVLWVPDFVPRGCVNQAMNPSDGVMRGAVICGSPEFDSRARALANLQFCWILSSILIFVASMCVVFGRQWKSRRQSVEYEQLSSPGVRDPIATVGFKQIQL